jgi:hypothetical protein
LPPFLVPALPPYATAHPTLVATLVPPYSIGIQSHTHSYAPSQPHSMSEPQRTTSVVTDDTFKEAVAVVTDHGVYCAGDAVKTLMRVRVLSTVLRDYRGVHGYMSDQVQSPVAKCLHARMRVSDCVWSRV